jgi:hypothetical protein
MSSLKHLFQLLGMYGVGISLVLGFFLNAATRRAPFRLSQSLYSPLIYGAFALSAGCSVAYLIYPNFIDHLEPTILVITQIWLQAGDIYPPTTAPSMHGLLYGPALYWIQAAFQSSLIDPILSSKLPGVLAFNMAWLLLFRHCRTPLAKGYLIFLLPFNLILFWNRAEPFFLLIVACAIWLAERPIKHKAAYLGLLAGLACALKAHGILYVLPIFIFHIHCNAKKYLVFAFVATLTTLAFFIDAGTSLFQYLAYLKLATTHGIAWPYLEKNLFFLGCIWLPLALTLTSSQRAKPEIVTWGLIATTETLIAIVGAKPGAGVHHLIPVIAANAYLYDRLLHKAGGQPTHTNAFKLSFAILAVYIMFFAWKNVYDSEIQTSASIQSQSQAASELKALARTYPHLFMGVTDKENNNYRLTFLRPYLVQPSAQQFEYAGFMDLSFAGVSADFLADDFIHCKYPYVVTPLQGEPFSILNFYNNQLLFPKVVQDAFLTHYRTRETGKFYKLYECH